MSAEGALAIQIGGNHYKETAIQPVQFAEHNGLSFCEGNIIKYLCRSRKKNGLQDVQKAGHYLQLLIQMNREIPGGLPSLPQLAPIGEVRFIAQFPEMTRIEKDVIKAVNNWRRAPAGMQTKNANRIHRLLDISREWHLVERAWANSSPAAKGANQ